MPPAGFKRSRALWDEARRPREKKADEWKSLLRAILYELQPIRFSQYPNPCSAIASITTHVVPWVARVSSFVATTLLPRVWQTIRTMTPKQWMLVAAVILYYFVVRWIHEALDAGPLVLIITALVAIFTVGLGENDPGELSAYSVFNRGFQRLMGSVDVEQLVNQHVGGGMAMMGGGMDMEEQHHPNNEHNNNNARGRRRPAANRGEERNEEEQAENDENDPPNVARKSGKKARRKNREEKHEQRRQREAAMAMGLDGTGGQEEMMAMQRLIEEEAAAGGN